MRSFKSGIVAFAAAGIFTVVPYVLASSDGVVAYPDGFRQFDHVSSMIVEPGSSA